MSEWMQLGWIAVYRRTPFGTETQELRFADDECDSAAVHTLPSGRFRVRIEHPGHTFYCEFPANHYWEGEVSK